jgi:hypothetical protein
MFIRWIVASVLFFNQAALAQILVPTKKLGFNKEGNEYYVGQDVGQPLVTVNLLSGVNQPGVYHVPISTDIAQLISYAGGTTPNADLSDVVVRREKVGTSRTLVSLDLESELKSKHDLTVLQDRDIVHISQKTTMDNTLRWVALISGIASAALSVALIDDLSKR